ncbi:MAG TPA: class I SAM-dependent methyltransferase [Rubrivivax sp.]|nr:class I SAM-dependent methyltransferase [Rubrivivax sp.]
MNTSGGHGASADDDEPPAGSAGADGVRAMQAYYARRAHSYERIYHKPERQAELRAIERAFAAPDGPFAGRRVLEIACGSGWWTLHAARHARSWLATDLSPETLALARAKAMPRCVRLAELDAYTLAGLEALAPGAGAAQQALHPGGEPPAAPPFDGAFAACWWSHVPLARLQSWLALLHSKLAAGARVVFLDNLFVPGSSTPIARRDAEGNSWQRRRLDDGSTHEVLKNFPARDEALARLGPRARAPEWIEHRHYWLLSYTLA